MSYIPHLHRQSSVLSEREGHSIFGQLPKPRTTLAADDSETERGDDVSPTRPSFTPIGSPVRRFSDSVNSQLVPPFQSTTIRRAESVAATFGDSQTSRSQSVRYA